MNRRKIKSLSKDMGEAEVTAASSPIKDVSRSIRPPVSMQLYGAAAGRCEFQGCNDSVLVHDLTLIRGNFGEKAHIVAFKEDGPRGEDGDRPEDINSIET